MNLPLEIIICILLKLPIKSIISFKCVSKQFLSIISSPHFARCHRSLATPGFIVHQFEDQDSCKIFEFEDVFDLQHHDLHYNLVTEFHPRKFITSPEPKIVLEGSINGLLLLRDFNAQPDSLYICNPITRECITLAPPECIPRDPIDSHFGFGLSPRSGEYKVLWNCHGTRYFSRTPDPVTCMIYTLGKGSWRNIEPGGVTQSLRSSAGVFFEENLHWLGQDYKGCHLITCFDLENEIFKPFCPLPPYPRVFPDSRSLVILQGCLCLCEYNDCDSIVIWMMKEYGQSWAQQFVSKITFQTTCETMYPIKVFKDGEMLILWEDLELFFYCNKSKMTRKVDAFEMVHYKGWTEAMLHTSSFVSLKSICVENLSSF